VIADAGIIPDVDEVQRCLHRAYLALRAASHIEAAVSAAPPPSNTSPGDPPTTEIAVPAESHSQPVTTAQNNANHKPLSQDNGNKSETPQQETAIQTQPAKIFSEAWAHSYQEVINDSPAYFHASTGWEAGPLAFIMHPSPQNGYSEASAILLDLYRGKCRSANALPVAEARNQAKFVLEGDYDNWIKVLRGEAQPIPMIVRNKLMLVKGSMFSLLPFTKSAQELVNCAQKIS